MKGHFPETFFQDYVHELERFTSGTPCDLFYFRGFYLGCCDHILDAEGNSLLSYVGKYENRAQCLHDISTEIRCPGLGKPHIQAAANSKGHYSGHYDKETRDIIAHI